MPKWTFKFLSVFEANELCRMCPILVLAIKWCMPILYGMIIFLLRSLLLFASRTLFLSFHLVKRLKILQPNNAERLSAVQGTPSANSWHFGTFRMDPSDGPLDSLDLNDRTFRATARPLCFFFFSLSLSCRPIYQPHAVVFPFPALAFSAASCAMTRPFSAFNWETFTCRLLQVENAALHWNMHRRTEWRSLTQKSNKCKNMWQICHICDTSYSQVVSQKKIH